MAKHLTVGELVLQLDRYKGRTCTSGDKLFRRVAYADFINTLIKVLILMVTLVLSSLYTHAQTLHRTCTLKCVVELYFGPDLHAYIHMMP